MNEKKAWQDYRLHIVALIIVVIAEMIGTVRVPLGIFSFSLAPLIWSMVLMLIFYLIPQQRIVTEKNSKSASVAMSMAGALLLAKLGVSSGAQIQEVLQAGLTVTLQNLGEGFSFVFALPLAVLFGMGREAVGMTFGVSREANVALITDKYGPDSPEFRGVMVNYICGTIFGVITVSIVMSLLSQVSWIRPESLALATGIGSASMMVGGLGTLIDRFPEMAERLEAYAAVSNIVSSVIGIYMALFIGLPLTERAYNLLNRLRGGKKHAE